jgi:hypothetical protein
MKKFNLFTFFALVIGVWLLTRPCSIRPFQNKSCWECGVEEGENKAIQDWNNTHSKEWQVDKNGEFINQ